MSDSSPPRAMERREFAKVIATGVLGAAVAGPATMAGAAAAPRRTPRKNTMHRVGGDYHCTMGNHWTSQQNFEFHLRHGVNSLSPDMDREFGTGPNASPIGGSTT